MNGSIETIPGQIRVHVSLPCSDLEKSVAFYESLFGSEPLLVKEDYAKWELSDPAVHFSLVHVDGPIKQSGHQHFGIQVAGSEAVDQWRARWRKSGLQVDDQEGVVCCYAKQDKGWAVDPDGHAWEIFATEHAVLDAPNLKNQPKADAAASERTCCPVECCN
jgi:catechol 2,3-dioxygenase-like lactoylglutathione lyase family enzyme